MASGYNSGILLNLDKVKTDQNFLLKVNQTAMVLLFFFFFFSLLLSLLLVLPLPPLLLLHCCIYINSSSTLLLLDLLIWLDSSGPRSSAWVLKMSFLSPGDCGTHCWCLLAKAVGIPKQEPTIHRCLWHVLHICLSGIGWQAYDVC